MKICFIIQNSWQIGGGDYAQFKYAEYLAMKGHDVTVFAQFHREFMDRLVMSDGLRMHCRKSLPPKFRGAGRINKLISDVYARMVILPFLKKRSTRPDVIIGYSKKSATLADRMAQAAGIPCAQVVFESPDWMSKQLGKLFDNINVGAVKEEWARVREVYRRADLLLPNSELTRQEVAAWTSREVEPPIYAGLEDPGELPEDPALGEHILYVGRLDVAKNVHDLIDAVALLNNPPPLVLVGRGHDEEELKVRASEKKVNVSFRGHISDEEKWRLMRSCRFLVFPTSFEGFGMPPGEALVCGKAAICSDIPILREVYRDYVEYFPLHDTQALAALMQRLLDDQHYCRSRGASGREFVLSMYTWDKAAERIEASLDKIVT